MAALNCTLICNKTIAQKGSTSKLKTCQASSRCRSAVAALSHKKVSSRVGYIRPSSAPWSIPMILRMFYSRCYQAFIYFLRGVLQAEVCWPGLGGTHAKWVYLLNPKKLTQLLLFFRFLHIYLRNWSMNNIYEFIMDGLNLKLNTRTRRTRTAIAAWF